MSPDTEWSQSIPERPDESTATVDLGWLTLDDGEEVLWASTPHKSSLIPALVMGVPLSLVLIGIPIIVASYFTYTNTNYVVTTRGLYRKRGILSRDVKQIGFNKVQNISYSQSAIGSRLGYGSVEISTAGSSGVELRFRSIPTPAAIQELISREIERREDSSRDGEADTDDVLDEILAELRGIRQTLDKNASTATGVSSKRSSAIGAEAESATPADESDSAESTDPVEPAVTESTDDE